MSTRTQAEILARIDEAADDDWLGFRRDVLISALDHEHAIPFLKEGVTAEQWNADNEGGRFADVEQSARDYYTFALGKIRGHRGISASRSVEKLTEFAWLLCRDDVITAMEEADYTNYGAPKVKAFAAGFGLDWPNEPDMERMAAGLPCEPGCGMGCG